MLDPTCGSGTTAVVSEQWGRRWITIDTSRVALSLAKSRVMGLKLPFYLLSDSTDGREKELEVSGRAGATDFYSNDIRQGFVCERYKHIKASTVSDNIEIDVIWDNYQETLEPLRQQLNSGLNKNWEEWEIPRAVDEGWPEAAIPIGAYEPREFMKDAHMNPEEAVKVFSDLGAQYAVGIHWGTFKLTLETMDEPPLLLEESLIEKGVSTQSFRALRHGEQWKEPFLTD